MSHPDNALEDVQAQVLRLVQRYELGQSRLGDLALDLAELTPLYDRIRGGLDDAFGTLLTAARLHADSQGAAPLDEWETALQEFRHSVW
jgi:hypothetical protein